jgi:hypothetical protein
MLTPYVHQATLLMSSEADLDAPGAAITLMLCGSWDHTPPCRFPHHVHAERTGATASLPVLFGAEPEMNRTCATGLITPSARVGSLITPACRPVGSLWAALQQS